MMYSSILLLVSDFSLSYLDVFGIFTVISILIINTAVLCTQHSDWDDSNLYTTSLFSNYL